MVLAWFGSRRWEAKCELNHAVDLAVLMVADLSQEWAH